MAVKVHNRSVMAKEHRKEERFDDYGHVDAGELCTLPGVLDDISLKGCKVRFPIPVAIDMENDYHLNISLPHRNAATSLRLLCHPQWKQMSENGTQIGFSFLRSMDTPLLKDYIRSLERAAEPQDDVYSLIINTQPVFVS